MAQEPEEPPEDDDPDDDPVERQTAILKAIGLLNAENPALWGQDGAPRVKALEAVLGFDISEDERNHAWEAYRQEEAAGDG